MSVDELHAYLRQGHTGVLVTQRKSKPGLPIPVWYWFDDDETIYISSPIRASKVAAVRRYPQVSFLVEMGKEWAVLQAVVINATTTVLESGDEYEMAISHLDEKYESFRTRKNELPNATQTRYANRVVLALKIDEIVATWDNTKLRLKTEAGSET